MMRTLVNGFLVCRLISIPVGVATAAKRKDITFKTLHECCETPTKERKFCPTCDRLVETDELGKGYEYAKKMVVPVDLGVLEQLKTESTRIIRIDKFVSIEEVNELAVEKSYYLTPPPKLPGYSLLSECMTEVGVVGIGSQALWGKETPAMVWANENGALVLSCLFCHDEIVPDLDIVLGHSSVDELAMGVELLTMLRGPLVPEEDLVSVSRDRMEEYVTSVVNETKFETTEPVPAPEPSVNILEVLQESIEQVRAGKVAA